MELLRKELSVFISMATKLLSFCESFWSSWELTLHIRQRLSACFHSNTYSTSIWSHKATTQPRSWPLNPLDWDKRTHPKRKFPKVGWIMKIGVEGKWPRRNLLRMESSIEQRDTHNFPWPSTYSFLMSSYVELSNNNKLILVMWSRSILKQYKMDLQVSIKINS